MLRQRMLQRIADAAGLVRCNVNSAQALSDDSSEASGRKDKIPFFQADFPQSSFVAASTEDNGHSLHSQGRARLATGFVVWFGHELRNHAETRHPLWPHACFRTRHRAEIFFYAAVFRHGRGNMQCSLH